MARYPRALALVLWGLDNIKDAGRGVSHRRFWLLGRVVRFVMRSIALLKSK